MHCHTHLLLEVGLVDACKGLDNDRGTAQVAWLQCCVLSATALSVVLVTDNHPWEATLLVVTAGHSNARHIQTSASQYCDHVDDML